MRHHIKFGVWVVILALLWSFAVIGLHVPLILSLVGGLALGFSFSMSWGKEPE